METIVILSDQQARYKVQLACGDAIKALACIDSQSIDVVVTDPPYGIQYYSQRYSPTITRTATNPHKRIIGDNDTGVLAAALPELYRVTKQGGALYVFASPKTILETHTAIHKFFGTVKNWIVWEKSNHGMGDLQGAYAPKYEFIVFAAKGRHILQGSRESDIWTDPQIFSRGYRRHPTEKHVSVFEHAIRKSCPDGGTVLDPFMGSGTAGEAALNLGRSFTGIEVDADYFQIAKERLETWKL